MSIELTAADQPTPDADVIIIGGGAAGCSTAIHLARRGRRVLLLEGRPPRPPQLSDLHSGEVLSPGSQRELARLGLFRDETAKESGSFFLERWKLQEWDTLVQRWPDGRTTRDALPKGIKFWQINRGNFYRALQERACAEGVEVRSGLRVINLLKNAAGAFCGVVVRRSEGENNVPFSLYAPVIVDASGRNSVVLARLGLREAEPDFGRAAYLFFFSDFGEFNETAAVPPPGVWQQFWLSRTTTLRGSQLAPGLYRYSFETSLAERNRWRTRWGQLAPYDLFLKVLAEQLPAEARRFEGATRLPHMVAFAPIGYRVRHICHDGLLLVGDAAGYLDPLTGQGIEFALRMGRLAAHSIAEAFEAKVFRAEAFQSYLQGHEAELQPLMRNLRLFLRLSSYNWTLNTVGRVAPLRQAAVRYLTTPKAAVRNCFKEVMDELSE